jgi:hypothetical protein
MKWSTICEDRFVGSPRRLRTIRVKNDLAIRASERRTSERVPRKFSWSPRAERPELGRQHEAQLLAVGERRGGKPVFHPVRAPRDQEVAQIGAGAFRRAERRLAGSPHLLHKRVHSENAFTALFRRLESTIAGRRSSGRRKR